MLTLQPIQENPFQKYHQLSTIWPQDLQQIAEEATQEFLEKQHTSTENLGQIFYILQKGEVVGLTGFFLFDQTHIGTRWHGIVPDQRHQGLSTQALCLLTDFLKQHYPQHSVLVESLPYNEHGRTHILPYFLELGFEPFDRLDIVDWHPDPWLPLSTLIHTLNQTLHQRISGIPSKPKTLK